MQTVSVAQSPLVSEVTPAPTLVQPKKVYVIPVKDEIEDALTFLIRRGVKEAIKNEADILILHMDTPGGKVKSTLEIIKILEKFPHQDQTYTFIDPWAISAGALISSATKNIYMSPTAIIGAAAPVMSSPTGGAAEQMPSTMEEKMNSALRAQIRALAERNGHRPEVFNAMVDKDQGLIIDGKEIVPKGKIVTLTAQESAKLYGEKPLLSKGTFENIEALIKNIAGSDAVVTTLVPTGFEAVGRFIVMLSPILLGGALLCGYIEFKTPGFGIFGIAAAGLALVFFFGHYVAGLSGFEYVILFLIGFILIAVELFVLPGTILIGLAGVCLIAISVLKAMVDRYPTDPFLPTLSQLELPVLNLLVSFVLGMIFIFAIARLFPKTPFYSKMVLAAAPYLPLEESSISQVSRLVLNQRGTALTPLHPSGIALFIGEPFDVITEGSFIEKDQPIRILQIDGKKIIVEAV